MTQSFSQQDTDTTRGDDSLPTIRLRKDRSSDESAVPDGGGPVEQPEASASAFKRSQNNGYVSHEAVDYRCESFPGMGPHAELFRDLHRADPDAAARLAQALTAMPVVGTEFHGFFLLAELGRGGLARVFLAEQVELAHRHVVLKVAPSIWGEAATLAQLRDANVIPIFSVHVHEPFQAICMPYRGWTTLQDVLHQLQARPQLPTLGTALFSVGKKAPIADSPPVCAEADEPNEKIAAVSKMTYVEAVVWLAAELSHGLAHAHERGILHHDLKPANILLADDGTPILLDFNAAEDTKRRAGPMPAWVGGTVAYMAPERFVAFQDSSARVDARSDLYAFGVILYELLTGQYPFEERPRGLAMVLTDGKVERRSAPPLRALNPAVSPALEAIVLRCLEADPNRRYPSARQLHDDLKCQHERRSKRHVVEPSTRKRVQKWTRQRATWPSGRRLQRAE